MPHPKLAQIRQQACDDFASSAKYQAQAHSDRLNALHMYGDLIAPLFAWQENELASQWSKQRAIEVSFYSSQVNVWLYLGVDDEYGEVNELIEIFEAGLMLADVDFVAPTEPQVAVEDKRRSLTYKLNMNTPETTLFSINIHVSGRNSEKCVVITETTDEIVPAYHKTKTRLLCAGDPEYAEYIKQEEAAHALRVQGENNTEAFANGNGGIQQPVDSGDSSGVVGDEGTVSEQADDNANADRLSEDVSVSEGSSTSNVYDDEIPF